MKKVMVLSILIALTNGISAKNNAANIPAGPYQRYCDGCTYREQTKTLTCSACANSYGEKETTSIKVDTCKPTEKIIDNDGQLACNPR